MLLPYHVDVPMTRLAVHLNLVHLLVYSRIKKPGKTERR
jgi:hypothetical protein